MKKAIFFLFLFFSVASYAQPSQDIQLADQYFTNGDFEKASVLYEKLWNKNQGNSVFYQNYLKCLTEMKQYGDAEKVVRKQVKKFPDDASLYVDLGEVYHVAGDEKNAKSQYDEALQHISPNMPQVT